MTTLPRIAATLALATLSACAPSRTRDTAPPSAAGHEAHAGHAAAPAANAADVRFMQHMIAHHAQALVMTELVPQRTTRQEIRLLAQRIEVSQRDEIAQMQRWLRDHGAATPGATASHAGHTGDDHAGMQGMLSAQEMARLSAASGAAFDRLFLESMIRHHEGALTMVAELFASPGGGQQPDVFRVASDVDSDQRMEIARMRSLLATLPTAAQPR